MKQHTCKRCGHSWYPRGPTRPKNCPKCNSPYWDKEKETNLPNLTAKRTIAELSCKRCGHSWYPKSPRLPKHCAKCNSPYWNVDRGWWKDKTKIAPDTEVQKSLNKEVKEREAKRFKKENLYLYKKVVKEDE